MSELESHSNPEPEKGEPTLEELAEALKTLLDPYDVDTTIKSCSDIWEAFGAAETLLIEIGITDPQDWFRKKGLEL